MRSPFATRPHAATALALVALAITGALVLRSPASGLAANETADIAVKASLDSCPKPKNGEQSCRIAVAFDRLAGAESYEVTIIAPDGSDLLTAPAEPGESVYSAAYVGDGTYGVRVTAFGPAQD